MESVREEYPKEILPRITFKYMLNVDKLLKKYPMLMAVRQVSGDINKFIHYCPVKILDLEINRVDHHPLGR